MSDEDWASQGRCLGIRLAGDLIAETDSHGEEILGDTLLILMNAHHELVPFELPVLSNEQKWLLLFDSAEEISSAETFGARETYELRARSTAVFRTVALEGNSTSAQHDQASHPAKRTRDSKLAEISR
jgi:glycogen operon protein